MIISIGSHTKININDDIDGQVLSTFNNHDRYKIGNRSLEGAQRVIDRLKSSQNLNFKPKVRGSLIHHKDINLELYQFDDETLTCFMICAILSQKENYHDLLEIPYGDNIYYVKENANVLFDGIADCFIGHVDDIRNIEVSRGEILKAYKQMKLYWSKTKTQASIASQDIPFDLQVNYEAFYKQVVKYHNDEGIVLTIGKNHGYIVNIDDRDIVVNKRRIISGPYSDYIIYRSLDLKSIDKYIITKVNIPGTKVLFPIKTSSSSDPKKLPSVSLSPSFLSHFSSASVSDDSILHEFVSNFSKVVAYLSRCQSLSELAPIVEQLYINDQILKIEEIADSYIHIFGGRYKFQDVTQLGDKDFGYEKLILVWRETEDMMHDIILLRCYEESNRHDELPEFFDVDSIQYIRKELNMWANTISPEFNDSHIRKLIDFIKLNNSFDFIDDDSLKIINVFE